MIRLPLLSPPFPYATPFKSFMVAALQSSLAVGGVKDGVAVHSIVASAPAAPITGPCVSTTVIACVLLAESLPQASVPSHDFVIVFVHPLVTVTSLKRFMVAA